MNTQPSDLPAPAPEQAPLLSAHPPLWLALLAAAMAGGMGWGIRGQYGHETGAMIPGLLVGLVLVFLFCPRATSLQAARAVALTAVAFSFGGSMTYGQTVGLTHDAPLLGNTQAFWWGMLGLFIKGGIWIGFAGAFLGIGLSERQYRTWEILVLSFALIALMIAGIYVLNEPFDPANHRLPRIYFSDHWRWEPDQPDLQPRRECWGGLLFALAGLTAYLAVIKRDLLGRNLALFGFLFGGLGFTLGQSIQAYRVRHEPFLSFDRYINWWNMMEITFGLVLGFGLALGLWLNRDRVGPLDQDAEPCLTPGNEWALIAIHAAALAAWSFVEFPVLDRIADHGLTMGVIPLLGIAGGRLWPYFLCLPLLALPIAGKTLRQMSYYTTQTPVLEGWVYYVILPLAFMLLAAWFFYRRGRRGQSGRAFTRLVLLLATWFYFAINFAFFEFPWPWATTTGRTPSAIIFLVCSAVLTLTALLYGWGFRPRIPPQRRDPSQPPAAAAESV